jgi:putative DNA primase/helicase
MQAAIDHFLRALAERGIAFKPDGEIHRCGTIRKPKSSNGAYCLHLDGKVPAGWYQNHEDGLGVTRWKAEQAVTLTEAKRQTWRREMERRRAEREAEQLLLHYSAAARAARIWERSGDVPVSHPYLERKRIRPHGLGKR